MEATRRPISQQSKQSLAEVDGFKGQPKYPVVESMESEKGQAGEIS